jgi:hypothetical protein
MEFGNIAIECGRPGCLVAKTVVLASFCAPKFENVTILPLTYPGT